MKLRHTLAIGLGACALTAGAVALAHRAASAAQNPIVLQRMLFGYVDRRGRFVATGGRGATNVERNALAMFVFSGAVDSGPNLRATLPLTLAEQADLLKKIQEDENYNPARDGYEIGVIPRRRTDDRGGYYVASGSVSPFSIVISALTQTGSTSTAAPGQFFKFIRPRGGRVDPSRILFNPRYQIATFNQPGEIDYNPEGLAPITDYGVVIEGGAAGTNLINTVRNRSGVPLAARFSSTFTTTNRYIQDFSRPLNKGTTPTDGTTNVAYDADIEVTFDEPMNTQSFVLPRFQGDDQWTMIVRYTQNALVNGTLAGRNVLGTIRPKPQTGGNVVQFRPLQGFGKGPYEIEVIVTTGVTDLSGNNIIRAITFTFRSESNPNADSFSQLTEDFVTNTQLETSSFTPSGDNQDASWNAVTAGKVPNSPLGAKGVLTTAPLQKTLDVAGPQAPTTTGIGINVWYHAPIRIQMMFPASNMGGRARALNGLSWVRGVYQAAGRTYTGLTLRLGHASDTVDTAGLPTTGPSDSNFGDIPVAVIPGTTYKTINFNPGASIYVQGPSWVKTFNYDGNRAMVLDLAHSGDPASTPVQISPGPPPTFTNPYDRWRADQNFPLRCSAVYIPSGPTTQVDRWLYSTRFSYLTPGAEAQSKFYDVGRNDGRLLPQQIVPTTQPFGTSVSFLWQGAKESETIPGTPDGTTLTAWLTDIRQLANHRFVRFRVTLTNNTATLAAPTVDILSIPYVWK